MPEYNWEKITCLGCGKETNHVPPDLPEEWDGYCPRCAIRMAEEGQLPATVDPVAILRQVLGKVGEMVGADIRVQVVVPDDENEDFRCLGGNEHGAWFQAKLSLN